MRILPQLQKLCVFHIVLLDKAIKISGMMTFHVAFVQRLWYYGCLISKIKTGVKS